MSERGPELSPKDRLDIARKEFSSVLLDQNPDSISRLPSRLALLQSALYANTKDLHPEAIFSELVGKSQLAIDKTSMHESYVDILADLTSLNQDYASLHKSSVSVNETITPQPTNTEALPPMTKPKTENKTQLKKSGVTNQESQEEEKKLNPKLLEVWNLMTSTDGYLTLDEIAAKINVRPQSVASYLSNIRASGRKIETVKDGKITVGYRAQTNPEDTDTPQN